MSDFLNRLNILYHTKVSAFHQRISSRSSILPLTMRYLVCYIFFNISVYSCCLPPTLFARLCLGISDTFETLPQPLFQHQHHLLQHLCIMYSYNSIMSERKFEPVTFVNGEYGDPKSYSRFVWATHPNYLASPLLILEHKGYMFDLSLTAGLFLFMGGILPRLNLV